MCMRSCCRWGGGEWVPTSAAGMGMREAWLQQGLRASAAASGRHRLRGGSTQACTLLECGAGACPGCALSLAAPAVGPCSLFNLHEALAECLEGAGPQPRSPTDLCCHRMQAVQGIPVTGSGRVAVNVLSR